MKTLAVLAISLLPWLAALDAERPEPSAPPPFGDTNRLAPPLDARPWSTNDTLGTTNGWQSLASLYIEEGTNWVGAYLSNVAGEGPDDYGNTRIKAKLSDFYVESTVLPAVTRDTDDVWAIHFDPALPPATNGPLDTMLNPAWVEEEKHGWPHTNFQYIPRPGTNATPIKLQSAEAARAPQPSFADGVLIATAVLRQNPGFAGLLSPQEQVALCLRVWQAQRGGAK